MNRFAAVMTIVALGTIACGVEITPTSSVSNSTHDADTPSLEYELGEEDHLAEFELDDTTYYQVIRSEVIDRTPNWDLNAGERAPLTLGKAIAAARTAVENAFPKKSHWQVFFVDIYSVGRDAKKWYYDIGFQSSLPEADDEINIIVLLDGTVPKFYKE